MQVGAQVYLLYLVNMAYATHKTQTLDPLLETLCDHFCIVTEILYYTLRLLQGEKCSYGLGKIIRGSEFINIQ